MESKRIRILKDIKSTLEGITTANGHDYDVQSVQLYSQSGLDVADPPVLFVDWVKDDRETITTNCENWVLTVDIKSYLIHPSDVTDTSLEYIEDFAASAQTVLMTDPTRGGVALDTHITQVMPMEDVEGQPFVGCITRIECSYRIQIGNPAV